MNRDVHKIFEEYKEIAPGVWRDVEDVATPPAQDGQKDFRVLDVRYMYDYSDSERRGEITHRSVERDFIITRNTLSQVIFEIHHRSLAEITKEFEEEGKSRQAAWDFFREQLSAYNISSHAAAVQNVTAAYIILDPLHPCYYFKISEFTSEVLARFDTLIHFPDLDQPPPT